MVESGLSLQQIRAEGRRIFSTPFNQHDGLGDGPNPTRTDHQGEALNERSDEFK